MEAIKNADSLAEIERLEKILSSGKVPSDFDIDPQAQRDKERQKEKEEKDKEEKEKEEKKTTKGGPTGSEEGQHKPTPISQDSKQSQEKEKEKGGTTESSSGLSKSEDGPKSVPAPTSASTPATTGGSKEDSDQYDADADTAMDDGD